MTLNNYTAVYDAGETSEVVIDNIVAIGAAIVSFASLVGLILLYGWMKKKI